METSMSVHWTTIRSLIEERLWSPTILYHPSRFSFKVTFFNDWSFHRRERVETGECWWKTLLNHRSGSGLGGRRSTMPLEGVSPYSSSITCWYRIPVTAYTGWHGQNLLGLLDNGETRLRERRSMCYIARSLLYGSFYPLSLRPSLSLVRVRNERRSDTSTLIVDLTSAIVSVAIGRCFVSSFFPLSFSFFREGGGSIKFFPLLSVLFEGLER